MKRRDGSSRRQVLDIDNPSTSWKSKFQAMTERRLNGSFQSSSLSKLVGSYASESDEEDGVKSKSLLDAKVDEFMKEVDSTKGNDDASIIPCAWQECYDEGTGYPYYWNMNTNEVTWEPPPELVAYQAAVAAKLAQTEAKVKAQVQQAQWAVEQAALGIIPEHPSPPKKISAPAPSLRKPSKFSSSGPPQSSNPRNQGRKRRPSSESEDEKIEMITSWVDEESEEEEETVNESQNRVSNNKKQNKDVSLKQSKPSSSSSSSAKKTEKIQKQTPMGPIGPPTTVVFGPKLPLPLSDTLPSKLKNRSRNGSTEEANEVESKVVIQKLRRLKTESDVIVGTRERVPIRKSLDRSRSGSPSDRLVVSKNKLVDSGSDSESGSEKSVLSRLQKHIEKLKDLGGSVPSDIKDLLTSATKSSSSSMTSADNIIALIEMEQPPDHKQDDKLLLSLKAAEQRVIRAVDRIEAERITNGSDKTKSQAQKPSSFALIAGYGDDSDQEEAVDSDTSTSAKDKTVKEKTLFPILGHEDNLKSDTSSKPVGKLPAVSDATVTLKANVDVPLKPSLVLDHGPGQKRKKRLDIGTIVPQPSVSLNSNTVLEVTDDPSKPKGGTDASTSGTASYTTAWSSTSSYSSDPTANDRRGFGFQVTPSDEEIATQQNKPKKGKISFIKAETINLTPEDSKNVRDGENEVDPLRKDTTSKSREDSDLHRSLSSLAQLVKAKLQFLNEGKEPVSPVQAMAIQIETLVSAWNAGALANSFLQRWLQSTGAELVQLERAAAPQGWAVQWDREYKRYFYCNLATKDTQWDYPVLPEDGSMKTEKKNEVPKPEAAPRAATPPPDDEDAMELCTTPPPEEDIESAACATPPPPRTFSPPPNPPPSKKLKTDGGDLSLADGESLESLGPSPQPPLPSAPQPPLPSSPPPPPPPPDTPPPPPPPGTPPSPTASSSSSSATTARVPELGEPLPPGVDNPADIPFIPVRPALPPAPMGHPAAHPGSHPMGADLAQVQVSHMALNPLQSVGVGTLHPGSVLGVPVLSGVGVGVPHAAMAMPYSGNVAVSVASSYPASTEAMLAGYNAVDYMGYMGVYAAPAGPLQVASVAAPPLQYTGQAQAPPQPPTHAPQRKKELMSELTSFYSDIASLDSNSRDATEDDTSQDAALIEQTRGKTSTPPVTVAPVAPVAPPTLEDSSKPQHSYEVSSPIVQAKSQSQSLESTADSSSARKKKKPKLAPGLTLKKKGVSNMVAKWQQVQEEVWKDYRNEENHE